MTLYDRYPDVMSGHPDYVQRLEKKRQERILDAIARNLDARQRIAVLEVGVGIGLFAGAAQSRGWGYVGVDRNQRMVDRLRAGGFTAQVGEVPPMPAVLAGKDHDVAYSAFVVEHLADGIAALEFVSALASAVRPGGLVVIVVPDAMSLQMEFWNLDYTHRFPTTERNLTQVLSEAELEICQVIRHRGPFWTGLSYHVCRFVGAFFSYRFWTALMGNSPLPYSAFQYLRQDVLMFIARKP